MWYVYLLQSKVNGRNYIGMTSDVQNRLKQHNAGKTKSIKAFIPYELIGYKEFTSKIEARKYEIRLKKSYLTKQEFIMAVFRHRRTGCLMVPPKGGQVGQVVTPRL